MYDPLREKTSSNTTVRSHTPVRRILAAVPGQVGDFLKIMHRVRPLATNRPAEAQTHFNLLYFDFSMRTEGLFEFAAKNMADFLCQLLTLVVTEHFVRLGIFENTRLWNLHCDCCPSIASQEGYRPAFNLLKADRLNCEIPEME
jgi:hypothetical protein